MAIARWTIATPDQYRILAGRIKPHGKDDAAMRRLSREMLRAATMPNLQADLTKESADALRPFAHDMPDVLAALDDAQVRIAFVQAHEDELTAAVRAHADLRRGQPWQGVAGA